MEIWKAIPQYEGLYEASSFGNIRSAERTITREDGRKVKWKEKQLSSSLLSGYLRVNLSRDGIRKDKYVHRLIAETFIGKIPEDLIVCHNDGNKLNNIKDNLRIDTYKSNQDDKILHGTLPDQNGNKNGMSKLTDEQCLEILKDNRSLSKISKDYDVSYSLISMIKNKKIRSYLFEKYENELKGYKR